MPSDIAVYGLGVMGRNIALNLGDQGLRVSVYNRTAAVTEEFMAGLQPGHRFTPCFDIEALADSLAHPRVVFLMATAGPVVDRIIEGLVPHLADGDVIIDGGNSHFADTQRRWRELQERGIRFLGVGISGGEEGARHGPSIMPGGDPEAWPLVRPMFESIAARADDGTPCCTWIGEGGAGHYVKMVHNGIEYGDMQLIAEAWQLLREGLGLDEEAVADTFAAWNRGPLSSYLVEITAAILRVHEADGTLRVDRILDAAGQKGTGRWTAIEALELGVPLTLISAAVFARSLSALKSERERAAARLGGAAAAPDAAAIPVEAVHDALYASKVVSYAQGFMQLREAAAAHGWQLDHAAIARTWRAGCIIRSRFLDAIATAFERSSDLPSMLLDDLFAEALAAAAAGWREAVILGVRNGLPMPATAAALAFYDGYRSATLPARLLQAQRDYFGAHSYQRVDRDPDTRWHTRWSGDLGEEAVDG
jgi:6-phosphogluconate dehydrogenase